MAEAIFAPDHVALHLVLFRRTIKVRLHSPRLASLLMHQKSLRPEELERQTDSKDNSKVRTFPREFLTV
jgi:hypothetical protein